MVSLGIWCEGVELVEEKERCAEGEGERRRSGGWTRAVEQGWLRHIYPSIQVIDGKQLRR